MTKLEKLSKVKSLSGIANLLGFKPNAVSYILYKIPKDEKYTEFSIPKKNGHERKIQAPIEKLKHIQRHLSDLLTECFEEINNIEKKESLSHGFRKKHSIVTNAFKHKKKRYVFNVDLKDFFPSINFGRVRGFFIKNRYFKLDKDVATVIAQIACHNNELPQGSPCSPIISNLIGHLLDIRMVNLAKKYKCTYSRYADDLTFSTNKKVFPENIAINNIDNNWIAGKSLRREIEKMDFKINEEKTSMQYKTGRQMTTGLIVNEKINIRKEYYKKARSMCYELFQTDEYYLGIELSDPDIEQSNKIIGTINQLDGILSFIYKIKRPYFTDKIGTRRYNPKGITKLYRNFLFYKHFFKNEKPLLICEGKTDIVYIKCALEQLADEYNDLVTTENGKYDLSINFLNISKNLRDVFAIATGTSGLKAIIDMYEDNIKIFRGVGKIHPVFVMIDNDSGSKEIIKLIKNKQKLEKIEPNKYYHFTENLYIIFTTEKENTEIEDLFDQKTLNTKLNGKIFNRAENFDSTKEYGKHIFAENVIKANKSKINFNNFKPIFNKLRKAIKDYSV